MVSLIEPFYDLTKRASGRNWRRDRWHDLPMPADVVEFEHPDRRVGRFSVGSNRSVSSWADEIGVPARGLSITVAAAGAPR